MFFATFYSIPWCDHLPKHFSCKGLLWTSVKVISTLPVKHSSKPIVLGQPSVFSWRMSPSFNMKWKGESYLPQDLTIKLEVFSHFLLLSTSCEGVHPQRYPFFACASASDHNVLSFPVSDFPLPYK